MRCPFARPGRSSHLLCDVVGPCARTLTRTSSGAGPQRSAEIGRPILFSHVPLYRPEKSTCGPLRERGSLRQGRGLGYQNLLLPEASQFLLQTVRPAVIFRQVGPRHSQNCHTHHFPAEMTTTTANMCTRSLQQTERDWVHLSLFQKSPSNRFPWPWAFADQAINYFHLSPRPCTKRDPRLHTNLACSPTNSGSTLQYMYLSSRPLSLSS